MPNRYRDEILIGNVLLESNGFVVILDAKGRTVCNQTFPHIDQLPIKSALYQLARMTVVADTAYIGGRDGIIFVLTLPMEFLKVADGSDIGESEGTDDKLEVIVSNITLPYFCIAEVFTYTADGVITACFNHTDNMLYIVNLHTPSDKSEIPFTPESDLSNLLPVGEVFYYVQHGHLLRADVARGGTQVATLPNCDQAWLEMNEYHYIIIQCENKSFLYVPQEWSDADGIKYGAWKNRDVQLEPCHGIGFVSFVFSVDGTMVTLYNTLNNFKIRIELSGNPDRNTLTCTWNGNLTFIYRDTSCNCWRQHQITEGYVNETSSIIPFSEGTLPPLVTNVNQSVLLLHPTYLLIPSRHQVLLDLYNNVSYPTITDNTVLYYAGIYAIRSVDAIDDVKTVSDDGIEDSSTGTQWPVYLAVTVVIVVVVVLLLVIVAYKKRQWILKVLRRDHFPQQESTSVSGIQETGL